MKWIVLVRPRNSVSLLVYEYDHEAEARGFFAEASENSNAHLRLFCATLAAERAFARPE